MGVGEIIASVGMVVAGLVWLVRQEGRLNGHDIQHIEHQKRHDEMRGDISYIRDRIDRATGGR